LTSTPKVKFGTLPAALALPKNEVAASTSASQHPNKRDLFAGLEAIFML
jgi:hypothetical protein